MSMPWKRVVRWSLFLAALTLLGLGIYRFEPDEPRWTASSLPVAVDFPVRISADGKTLYTSPYASTRLLDWVHLWPDVPKRSTPKHLTKWNLATGKPGDAYPTKGRLTAAAVVSNDGRYFAGICEWDAMTPDGYERFVCLVDAQSGEERQLPLSCSFDDAEIRFSPCSQFFVVGTSHQPSLLRIYESATGQLLDERCGEGMHGDDTFTKHHLLHVETNEAEQRQLVLWSLHDRNIAARFDLHGMFRRSADGKYLLVQGKIGGDWIAWNLPTLKIESAWQTTLTSVFQFDLVNVGDRCIACLLANIKDHQIAESWDISSGKRCFAATQPSRWGLETKFSPNGQFRATYGQASTFEFYSWEMPSGGFYLHEVPTFRPLWKLDPAQRYLAVFTNDGDRLIVAAKHDPIVHLRDCATGQVRQTIIAGANGTNNGLTLTKDGKHLLIQHTDGAREHGIWHRLLAWTSINLDRFEPAFRDVTIVYDLEANRERLRLRGWNVSDALLSEDGATLITTHDDEGGRVMRCWDVGATKPWRWPLTIPPLAGAAFWGMAKGVARWRQRRTDAKPAATGAS